MSLIPLGILASSLPAGGNALTLISTQVLSSGASSVTFSSIPSTYKHLQIRAAITDSSGAGIVQMQYNSDTGSNYSWHYLAANGSSVTSYNGTTTTAMRNTLYYWGIQNAIPTGLILDILDYSSTTKYKTSRAFSGAAGTSANEMGIFSGLWQNTAAVSSIRLFTGGTYNAGSRFSLYGVA